MVMYIVPGPNQNAHKPRFSEDGGGVAQSSTMESFLRSPNPSGQPHPMPGTTIRPDHKPRFADDADFPSAQLEPEDHWEKDRWEVFRGSPMLAPWLRWL
jgi:hypothetical protein